MLLCIGATPAVQRIMLFRRINQGAVNRAFETVEGVAGKSINVAKVLKTLGGAPLATGFLGGERGRFIAQELHTRGVAADFVAVAAPTRQCITVIDESAHTVTELVEESRPVGVRDYERLLAKIRRQARRCRAIVISGSLTPTGPPAFYRRCVELANRVGALSVVDAQGPGLREALKARPGVIKPNRAELAATVGRALEDERSILKAMRQLCTLGAQRVVVTAGASAILAYDGQTAVRVTPPRVRPLNPIGSGDSFTAALLLRVLRKDDLGDACCWAAAAATANTLTLMPGEFKRADVTRLLERVRISRIPE